VVLAISSVVINYKAIIKNRKDKIYTSETQYIIFCLSKLSIQLQKGNFIGEFNISEKSQDYSTYLTAYTLNLHFFNNNKHPRSQNSSVFM
jgi:hypothetical protein